jgi:hypothetical protein
MLLIARQLWSRYFPTTPLPPDDDAGRRETIDRVVRAVGRDHSKPEALTANAILDHKMHCGALTDEQALRFLTDDAFQSEGEARLKLIRAKQSSVQLSSYFVGRMAFMRLRQQMQRELGSEFNLARFHEAVLEQGSVPVKYLPELVRASLQTKKSRP